MNVLQGYIHTCALSPCLPSYICFWSSDCLCMYATLNWAAALDSNSPNGGTPLPTPPWYSCPLCKSTFWVFQNDCWCFTTYYVKQQQHSTCLPTWEMGSYDHEDQTSWRHSFQNWRQTWSSWPGDVSEDVEFQLFRQNNCCNQRSDKSVLSCWLW